MIALPPLVVVADDALIAHPVIQPVFEPVTAPGYCSRNAPDHHLQDRPIVKVILKAKDQRRWRHMAHDAIDRSMASSAIAIAAAPPGVADWRSLRARCGRT